MSGGATLEVPLRRTETSQPWGFRLRGGSDQGIPLHVEGVNPKGRSYGQGLRAGDMILAICNSSVQGLSHDAIKGAILRAGNDLDFTVQRGVLDPSNLPAAAPEPTPRVEIIEQPTIKMGGPTYKNVQTKTMSVLSKEIGDDPDQPTPGGAPPASIFSRKKEDRSQYLQSKGKTIQTAYGERP